MSKKRTIGELNYETKLIIELLEQSTVGDPITLDMISDLIGSDIRLRRDLLDTARRIVLRDHNIVFDTIHGVGIVRVTDGGKGLVFDKRVGRIRNATRRAVKVLDAVDTAQLERDELSNHMQRRSVAGLLEAHTKIPKKPEPKPRVENKDTGAAVQEFLAKHRKK